MSCEHHAMSAPWSAKLAENIATFSGLMSFESTIWTMLAPNAFVPIFIAGKYSPIHRTLSDDSIESNRSILFIRIVQTAEP